jgi:hypothetical protein
VSSVGKDDCRILPESYAHLVDHMPGNDPNDHVHMAAETRDTFLHTFPSFMVTGRYEAGMSGGVPEMAHIGLIKLVGDSTRC